MCTGPGLITHTMYVPAIDKDGGHARSAYIGSQYRLTQSGYQGIRVSYLDWEAFSHGLF